jgi:hypothetical protein
MTKKFIVIFQKPLIMAMVFGLFWLLPTVISPLGWPAGNGMAYAQEAKLTVRGSGLPVPRYVTLKFDEANLRAGPGRRFGAWRWCKRIWRKSMPVPMKHQMSLPLPNGWR